MNQKWFVYKSLSKESEVVNLAAEKKFIFLSEILKGESSNPDSRTAIWNKNSPDAETMKIP